MDAADLYSIDVCKEKYEEILKEIYFDNDKLQFNQIDAVQEDKLGKVVKEYKTCQKQKGFIPPITFYTNYVGMNITKLMTSLSPQQRIDLKEKSSKVYQIIKSSMN